MRLRAFACVNINACAWMCERGCASVDVHVRGGGKICFAYSVGEKPGPSTDVVLGPPHPGRFGDTSPFSEALNYFSVIYSGVTGPLEAY